MSSVLLEIIDQAGMKLKKEYIDNDFDKRKEYEPELDNIIKRCKELSVKHPEDKKLFEEYIQNQKREYSCLENEIVCSTMVICHQ